MKPIDQAPPLPKIEAAVSASTVILAERSKLRAAIAAGEYDFHKCEMRLCVALAAVEAAGPDAVRAPLKRGVDDARERLEAAKLRLADLQAQFAASEGGLMAAQSALDAARLNFKTTMVEEFRQKYLAAANAFAEVVREGIGLSEALGVEFPGLRRTMIRDLDNPHAEAVFLFQSAPGDVGPKTAWRNNPAARRAYDSANGPKLAALALACELKRIRAVRGHSFPR